MWIAFAAVLLAQTPADSLDVKKLELVLQLSGLNAASAEKALREDVKGRVAPLSFAVRAQGPMALLGVLKLDSVGCGSSAMFMGPYAQLAEPTASSAAAVLLAQLAKEHEEVRLALAQSGRPLELFLAVLSAWDDEAALEKLAPRLEVGELGPSEHRLAIVLQQCSMMRGGGLRATQRRAVLARLAKPEKGLKCETAEDAAELVKLGPVNQRGWGSNGSGPSREVYVSIEAAGGATNAKPDCVVALYDATFEPKLLEPLVATHAPQEARALDRLERDLARFSGEGRKTALKALIGSGRKLDLITEFSTFEREHDDQLIRGALLANLPTAKALLFSKLGCPSQKEHAEYLALLKDKQAAKAEALRVAATCPREGIGAAQVLVTLGDWSWVKHLPRWAEEEFGKFDLNAFMEAQWNPRLEAQVKALPSTSAPFVTWRRELLERLAKKQKH